MADAVRGASVLVVEDDDDLGELMETMLRRAGYAVEGVRDGGAALRRLRDAPPDVMVLDLGLPGRDGFEVLLEMAALPHRPRTMVVTARHAAGDVETSIALGASDFLGKPFQPEQLLARVARLARRRPG